MMREITQPEQIVADVGDVYQVQRRPRHAQVVVNDRYRGIRVVDPWRGTDVLRLPFTPDYDPAGIVDAWCFRADGGAALVLSESGGRACLLDLSEDGARFDLDGPAVPNVSDLRYVWDGSGLFLTAGKSLAYWQLRLDSPAPALREVSGIAVRKAERRWRQALDSIATFGTNVLRVEPDAERMLVHDYAEEPGRIGVVAWGAGESWSIPAPAEVPRLASLPDRLFVRHDDRIDAFDRGGNVRATIPAPEGFRFGDLDTIGPQPDRPAAVVVACLSLDDPGRHHLRTYRADLG